ncbi:alpha/beta fold hydrolase [Neolewinella antarctica]|uniref:Pimeloyl-ACP methyl ester carboxylesterase n=1 Tax=Neolewinella antarctica TaxID=442734 RepID=A0ABX0X8W0_9BACT|nr:alpha/beta fold hydrolase [Neolewinella antarctica]NJC25612.1 pimeloyl-ACP methyl ester carboxylesterase [Neolewinella antarctica]
MASLFKSESGKKEILELYDDKLRELEIVYQYKTVDTSYGATNLVVTGSASNPPLIIIHGSNACAPISLETYPNLSAQFQVFAVDVLAQPNKSAETRLSMEDDSYGKWLNEVIASLELEDVTLVGFSFAGLVILKTLADKEDRIKEVFLAAPAYLVNGNPFVTLLKVFLPMKLYQITKKRKFVEKFLNEIFTERDEFAIKYLSKVFLHFRMDFTPVPVISTADAGQIKTPITLIAAGKDLLFPGKKMVARFSKLFPFGNVVLLENSKHVQNRTNNRMIQELIMRKSSVTPISQ